METSPLMVGSNAKSDGSLLGNMSSGNYQSSNSSNGYTYDNYDYYNPGNSNNVAQTNFWQPSAVAAPKMSMVSNNTSFLTGNNYLGNKELASQAANNFPGYPYSSADSDRQHSETILNANNNSSSNSKFGRSHMNINAPSYVPGNFTSSREPQSQFQRLKAPIDSTSHLQHTETKFDDDHHRLKVEMILKNQIIKNLTDQLSLVNKPKTKSSTDSSHSLVGDDSGESLSGSMKIPSNHYQLFQDLSRTLEEKSAELESTKERLEALLVGISMNQRIGSGFTNTGQYDEQELTHKIVSKLTLLRNENENLLKMISFSNKSSLLVELGLLKNENRVLKEKLSALEK